jgi:Xaa-Pro aminopeptidase
MNNIQTLMAKQEIDACLIADNANIFYLSRRIYRGYVYIPANGAPLYLVIRPIGLQGEGLHYIRKPELIPELLAQLGLPLPKNLGLELDEIPFSQIQRFQKIFPEAAITNVSGMLKTVRMVKRPDEVELIRQDGEHHVAAYSKIKELYTEGMTDVEFQIEIERVLRQEGSLGHLRTSGALMEINMGSVLNGDNADAPAPYDFAVGGAGVNPALPVGACGKPMAKGTTVMVDMNGNFNGYQTDLTRTYRIGEVPALAQQAHDLSIKILRTLEKLGTPGTPVAALYDKAIELAEEAGLSQYFMGHTQQSSFIGHGVGIQLNELPVVMHKSRHTLEENMVLALEPKFVIPGVGAVGVENTYLVRAQGLESLTPAPEELANLL